MNDLIQTIQVLDEEQQEIIVDLQNRLEILEGN